MVWPSARTSSPADRVSQQARNALLCLEWRGRAASQWGKDHKYLVTVVAWSEPQSAGPSAGHFPAQPGVETLQPGAATRGEVELLQAHLLAGDAPGVHHQSAADTLTAEGGESLQMADGAPMSDNRIRLTPQVHPAGQGMAGQREQEPAAPGAEAGDELVRA